MAPHSLNCSSRVSCSSHSHGGQGLSEGQGLAAALTLNPPLQPHRAPFPVSVLSLSTNITPGESWCSPGQKSPPGTNSFQGGDLGDEPWDALTLLKVGQTPSCAAVKRSPSSSQLPTEGSSFVIRGSQLPPVFCRDSRCSQVLPFAPRVSQGARSYSQLPSERLSLPVGGSQFHPEAPHAFPLLPVAPQRPWVALRGSQSPPGPPQGSGMLPITPRGPSPPQGISGGSDPTLPVLPVPTRPGCTGASCTGR